MNARLIRRSITIAAIALAVLIGAVVIFAATFDVNRYKPQIEAAVQQRTGRTIRFDGDLALTVFPRLSIRLPPTTLSEPGRDAVFARLQSGQARVALFPLLRGDVVIDAVRIDGLQAVVVRNRDGRTNVDDIIRSETGAPGSAKAAPGASAGTTTIGRIELSNADLTWSDLATGRTVRLTDLDADIGRIAPSARSKINASAAISSDEPAINARVKVSGELEWNAQGTLRGAHDASLAADGTAKQQPLTLQASADRLLVDGDVIDLRALKVSGRLGSSDGAPLDVRLTAPRLDIRPDKATGDRVEIVVKRAGPDALDVIASIDGLHGNAKRFDAGAVKISATSRTAAHVIRIALTSPMTASLADKSVRFDTASGEAEIEAPSVLKPVRLPFEVSGQFDGLRESVALQLKSHADALAGQANITINGFSVPRFNVQVDAEQIDVDRLAGFGTPSSAGNSSAGNPRDATAKSASAAPDTKVNWAALRGIAATGNVRVAKLRIKNTDAADLRLAMKAADGQVDISPINVRMHGGSLSGRVALDARARRATASGAIAGVQLRRVVSDIAGRAALEGRANGNFSLATSGGTVTQLKRALDGNATIDVREGALVGIDLGDLIGSAATLLQSRGRQTGAFDEKKRTPFSQLSANVRIDNGVATSNDIRARSDQLDITGQGKVDLVSNALDAALRAQVVVGPATASGPLRSVAGITVPVHIAGSVDQPTYAVDWTAVAADALLKRATGRAGSPAVNRVIEGLGGLLGGRKK